MWATAGSKTNPPSGTILADTGPLSGGLSDYHFVIATNVAVGVVVASRNAADTADLVSQFIPAQIGLTAPFALPIDVIPGGRVVVRTNANATGQLQASILSE
jgi:hypothetical protein